MDFKGLEIVCTEWQQTQHVIQVAAENKVRMFEFTYVDPFLEGQDNVFREHHIVGKGHAFYRDFGNGEAITYAVFVERLEKELGEQLAKANTSNAPISYPKCLTPVIELPKEDVILTSEITDSHIVLAVISKSPCILTKVYVEPESKMKFVTLSNSFSYGLGYTSPFNTLKETVEWAINKGYPIAVFHQEDWKQALQWLIDNA